MRTALRAGVGGAWGRRAKRAPRVAPSSRAWAAPWALCGKEDVSDVRSEGFAQRGAYRCGVDTWHASPTRAKVPFGWLQVGISWLLSRRCFRTPLVSLKSFRKRGSQL